MTIHNLLSEATGEAKVPVRLDHIQRALSSIRFHILKHKPEILPNSEALGWMDAMSFDDVILAATFLATVERLTASVTLQCLIEPLAVEGGMTVQKAK